MEESSGHRLNIAAPWTGGDFLAVASHLFGSADVSFKDLVRLLSYNEGLGMSTKEAPTKAQRLHKELFNSCQGCAACR